MRPLLLLAVGCSLLALGACESRDAYRAKREAKENLKTISKLDCPEAEGALKRLSVAPDGRSCLYQSGDAEVELRLVNLVGDDAEATLRPIETELRALIPDVEKASTDAVDGEAKVENAKAEAATDSEAPAIGEKETVRMPGLTVTTERTAKGEKADVRMPGITVQSEGEDSTVTIGGMRVEERDGVNEVRISTDRWSRGADEAINVDGEDVNISGCANLLFGPKVRGVRMTFIKTSDAAGPYGAVGYEARGPKKGPLAVAVVKVKGKNEGRVLKDVFALVKRNVGG